MTRRTSHRRLLERIGKAIRPPAADHRYRYGLREIARRLDLGPEMVHQWHKRNRVPPKHWRALVKISRGTVITEEWSERK